jgi:hypothetical protein
MTAGGHVRGEDHGLAVLHLAGDPGVLAGHTDGHLPLFQLGGLIQHQDRPRIGQVVKDEPLQRAQRRLPVPGVPGQQRLHGAAAWHARRPRPTASTSGAPRPPPAARRCRRTPPDATWPGRTPAPAGHAARLKFSQPAAILYDGRGGHLLILTSHKA